MKKENITLSMEAEKLRATKRYMEKKDADIEQELSDALTKLYEKHVPPQVREYIEFGTDDDTAVPEKFKRPAPSRLKKDAAVTSAENPTE